MFDCIFSILSASKLFTAVVFPGIGVRFLVFYPFASVHLLQYINNQFTVASFARRGAHELNLGMDLLKCM